MRDEYDERGDDKFDEQSAGPCDNDDVEDRRGDDEDKNDHGTTMERQRRRYFDNDGHLFGCVLLYTALSSAMALKVASACGPAWSDWGMLWSRMDN